MGGGLAQLFAEKGYHVSVKDPSENAMNHVLSSAKEAGFGDRLKKFDGQHHQCMLADIPCRY